MNIRPSKISALEALLRFWEDICFSLQFKALINREKPTDIAECWSDFRNYIKNFQVGQIFDIRFFEALPNDLRSMSDIPALVASWLVHSKRVFRLSSDMESRFRQITFGNIRISDIQFPFSAFAVELSEELVDERGYGHDLILFTNAHELLCPEAVVSDKKLATIHCLSSKRCDYVGVSVEKRMQIVSALRAGTATKKEVKNFGKYFVQKVTKGFHQVARGEMLIVPTFLDQSVDEYLLNARHAGLSDFGISMIKILFNLSLYLQSLPPCQEKKEGVLWREVKVVDRGFPSPMIRSSNLCDIVGHQIIESMVEGGEGSKKASQKGWELPPHWRRAHARRAPGKGNDPTAEKSVKVRHALVRGDRIHEFEGVVGSLSEIAR